MKTRRGGLSFRKSSSPRRPRTLVDLLERDIERDEGSGPDWYLEVGLACAVQDMEWALRIWDEANLSLGEVAECPQYEAEKRG